MMPRERTRMDRDDGRIAARTASAVHLVLRR